MVLSYGPVSGLFCSLTRITLSSQLKLAAACTRDLRIGSKTVVSGCCGKTQGGFFYISQCSVCKTELLDSQVVTWTRISLVSSTGWTRIPSALAIASHRGAVQSSSYTRSSPSGLCLCSVKALGGEVGFGGRKRCGEAAAQGIWEATTMI